MSVQTVCLEPNGPRLRAAADTATWMSFSSHQRLRVAALKILTQLRNSCAEILADNWKKPSHTRYWGACVSGPARQKPKATCWCKSLAAKTCTTDKLNILKIYSSISTCQGNQQVTLCSTTAAAEGQAPKWPKPQSHFSVADFLLKSWTLTESSGSTQNAIYAAPNQLGSLLLLDMFQHFGSTTRQRKTACAMPKFVQQDLAAKKSINHPTQEAICHSRITCTKQVGYSKEEYQEAHQTPGQSPWRQSFILTK